MLSSIIYHYIVFLQYICNFKKMYFAFVDVLSDTKMPLFEFQEVD